VGGSSSAMTSQELEVSIVETGQSALGKAKEAVCVQDHIKNKFICFIRLKDDTELRAEVTVDDSDGSWIAIPK